MHHNIFCVDKTCFLRPDHILWLPILQLCNHLVLIILEQVLKSANSYFTVLYSISLYRDTKLEICDWICKNRP